MKLHRLEYALTSLWLVFCAYTLYQAQEPGFVDVSRWSYPWFSALTMCLVQAALIVWFHAIVRASSSIWRNLGIVAYVLLLVPLIQILFITDMPGHYYVPGVLATIAFFALLVWGAIQWWKSYVYAA